jgi:hypothetical protein
LNSDLVLIGILNGHSGPVLSALNLNENLITGGTDKRIFIWNKKD